MSSDVIFRPRTLSHVVLHRWGFPIEDGAFQAVSEAAVQLFPHSFYFWELYPDSDRVDLSVGDVLTHSRAKARIRRWLKDPQTQERTSARALQMLQRWLVHDLPYTSVIWEQDAPTGHAGIFVTVDADADFSGVVEASSQHFALPATVTQHARKLVSDLSRAFRPIAVGSFDRPGTPQELRMILRPTRADWLHTLPQDLRASVADLLTQVPAHSDVNLALGIGADRIASALEARYSAEPHPTSDWLPWLDEAFPARRSLHECILEKLQQEQRAFTPQALPAHLLLDAFVLAPGCVFAIRPQVSHVKVQRLASGELFRKLYIRADAGAVQLG